MNLTCESRDDGASLRHLSAVILSSLALSVLLTTAAPVQASVYAIEQKDGSWRVKKYNDNDPTVRVTQLNRDKTIKVDKDVELEDVRVVRYTSAGEARLAAYFKADRDWLKLHSRKGISQSKAKPFLGTCINGVCMADCINGVCEPEPGFEGRPPFPAMEKGHDFTYGVKTVGVKVDAPNPDYLKSGQPWYILSDRAKKPGGRWLFGTTVKMTNQEFTNYLLYLERGTP